MKKLSKPVLVETEEKSRRGDLVIDPNGLGIHINDTEPSFHNKHHLHIISIDSNEKIEEGDLCWDINGNIQSYVKKAWTCTLQFKIIASTDKSLNLPQPSPEYIKQFIKEYNAGYVKYVKVEYEQYHGFNRTIAEVAAVTAHFNGEDYDKEFEEVLTKQGGEEYRPKLTNDFITIHPFQPIKPIVYTEEEVKDLLLKCNKDLRLLRGFKIFKWFESNKK